MTKEKLKQLDDDLLRMQCEGSCLIAKSSEDKARKQGELAMIDKVRKMIRNLTSRGN